MKFEIDLNDNELDLLFEVLEDQTYMYPTEKEEEILNLIKKFKQAISKTGR